jgi:hypothetical protein
MHNLIRSYKYIEISERTATRLDMELELAQLRQVLKVLGLANASIAIPNGL